MKVQSMNRGHVNRCSCFWSLHRAFFSPPDKHSAQKQIGQYVADEVEDNDAVSPEVEGFSLHEQCLQRKNKDWAHPYHSAQHVPPCMTGCRINFSCRFE